MSAPEMTDATYSSFDVAALANVSYRQLDYWCRLGLLTPSVPAQGYGTQRRWTRHEVSVAVVASRFRALGASATDTRAAVAVAAGLPLADWDDVLVVDGAGVARVGLTPLPDAALMVSLGCCVVHSGGE